nr:putative chloride channel-like protein CLC-g [Tanacetum cinerariifolium]
MGRYRSKQDDLEKISVSVSSLTYQIPARLKNYSMSASSMGTSWILSFQIKDLKQADTATRWVKYVPIKVNIFMWKLFLDRLPTRGVVWLRKLLGAFSGGGIYLGLPLNHMMSGYRGSRPSGIPEVKAYLNGVDAPAIFSFRSLVIKGGSQKYELTAIMQCVFRICYGGKKFPPIHLHSVRIHVVCRGGVWIIGLLQKI